MKILTYHNMYLISNEVAKAKQKNWLAVGDNVVLFEI